MSEMGSIGLLLEVLISLSLENRSWYSLGVERSSLTLNFLWVASKVLKGYILTMLLLLCIKMVPFFAI